MKSVLLLPSTLAAVVVSVHAQVREITLGININCRSGLSECYVMVGKGLERLDGVSGVAERPSNSMRTCVIQTRDGRFLEPVVVADQLQSLQIGARLRAMEATVDGHAEIRDGQLLLRVPGEAEQTVVLRPLTEKVQWDEAKDAPQRMTATERSSYAELRNRARSVTLPIRVTGPVRQEQKNSPLSMEVRDFELHPEFQPDGLVVTAVLRLKAGGTSNTAFVSLREQLLRLDWVESVAEDLFPRESRPAFEVRVRGGRFPDDRELRKLVRLCFPGARVEELQLRATSACYLAGNTPVVKARAVPNSYHELEIAGTRSTVLFAQSIREPKLMQWAGKLKKSFAGRWRLEVESLRDGEGSAPGTERSERPQAPLLQASTRDGRTVDFEWFHSSEEDIRGYNIYRMDPSGAWSKINGQPLSATFWYVEVPLDEWYAVTALGASGRESICSRPISPAPPQPPKKLRLRNGAEFAQLSWLPNTELDFSSYNIYRSERPAGPYKQIAVGVTQTTYSDPFTREKTSYYVVTATDSSGNQSIFSEEVEFRFRERLASN